MKLQWVNILDLMEGEEKVEVVPENVKKT